ncbi:MAG: hypothetical protein COZ32_06905 [Nitrospirae bacterium CG_4_10_14_3_um_filter_53_41]|nr:MAG: hypothetical protein COZ95_04415 [Nitrospirae bacterium CG_4_8_14_3_um_filter_50_41]PIX85744.1 MAG: hypothetical protein COZ32_06905 [Nitrospirae bacterium CG_4_10_14_3_um_filter_53_41]
MNSQNRSKLNQILRAWPQGTVAVHSWLSERGVYRQLVDAYRKTAWLDRLGRGAFIREGDSVDWTGGLYAVQEQLGLSIHGGGKTALQIQGYAHYLPLGKDTLVSLFGSPGEKLPVWFRKHDWGVKLRYTTTKLFPPQGNPGITIKEMGAYSIRLSSPERAIMELLYYVPRGESFEEARLLMEGLTTLRPGLVQTLLEACGSVKVKRLFMYLTEVCNHAWVKKLDLSKIDFGKGKRMIVTGGRLDPKYKISVPVDLSGTMEG